MIRGTNYEQDNRFVNKQKRLISTSQWPDQYDVKIDLSKVDFELFKIWIEKKINQLTKDDDDIPASMAIAYLQQNIDAQTTPDPKKMHIIMSGLLKDHTLIFMVQLWRLLAEAQATQNGIPSLLVKNKRDQQKRNKDQLKDIEYRKRKFDDRKVKKQEYRSRSRSNERRRQKQWERDRERNRERQRRYEKERQRENQRQRQRPKYRERQTRRQAQPYKQKDQKIGNQQNELKVYGDNRRQRISDNHYQSERNRNKDKTRQQKRRSKSRSRDRKRSSQRKDKHKSKSRKQKHRRSRSSSSSSSGVVSQKSSSES